MSQELTEVQVRYRVQEYRSLSRVRNARKEGYPSRAYIDIRKHELHYELLHAGYDTDGNPIRGETDD